MPMNQNQARIIDPILTTHAQGYIHPVAVGHHLFPRVPVHVAGGQVLSFGPEDFKLINARRAPGSNTKRIEYGHLSVPFALVQDALEGKVPFEIQRDAQRVPGIDLGTRATNKVLGTLNLGLEYEQSVIATTPANYDGAHQVSPIGAGKWTDGASDPTADINTGREAIRQSIGMRPNVLILSAKAYEAAKDHPKLVARFQYTTHESLTPAMLANLWGFAKLEVGEAVYWDEATNQMVDVWGGDVVMAYVPTADLDMGTPSYGWTYTMDGNPVVEQAYYDKNAKSWIYPVTFERVPVQTGMKAGYLIKGAV